VVEISSTTLIAPSIAEFVSVRRRKKARRRRRKKAIEFLLLTETLLSDV
jgi:hypothetical protein